MSSECVVGDPGTRGTGGRHSERTGYQDKVVPCVLRATQWREGLVKEGPASIAPLLCLPSTGYHTRYCFKKGILVAEGWKCFLNHHHTPGQTKGTDYYLAKISY